MIIVDDFANGDHIFIVLKQSHFHRCFLSHFASKTKINKTKIKLYYTMACSVLTICFATSINTVNDALIDVQFLIYHNVVTTLNATFAFLLFFFVQIYY